MYYLWCWAMSNKPCQVCGAIGDGNHHDGRKHLLAQQKKQEELQYDPKEELGLRLVDDVDKVIDEPWDEITAKHWDAIRSGAMTIRQAYAEEGVCTRCGESLPCTNCGAGL